MGNALQMPSIHTELRPTGALLTDRGPLLLIPFPLIELSSRVVDRPEGSVEQFDKVLSRTCFGVLLLAWIRGLALVRASLVKGPHESGAT